MKGLLITRHKYRYISGEGNFGSGKIVKNLFARLRSNTIGIGPHLGMGIVASEFKKNGVNNLTFKDIYDPSIFEMEGDSDFVGISFMDIDQKRALEIANHFSDNEVPVLLGGQRPTLGVEDLLDKVDSTFIIGEFEGLAARVVEDLQNKCLKRTYARSSPLNLELDYVIPDRSIPPLDTKLIRCIELGRGCHNYCDFCSARLMQPQIRLRNIGQIIEELNSMKRKSPLMVIDNNLGSYPPEYLKEIFTIFNEKRILWGGEGTLKTFYENPDLLDLMKHTCLAFFTGIEDFNGNTSGARDKQFKEKNYNELKELLRPFKQKQIPLYVSLVLGTDQQFYPESFESTVNRVNELGVLPLYHIATPHPGTKWHKNVVREGRIINSDLSYYDHKLNVIHQPKNMTPEELSQGFEYVYRKTFLDPRSYVKRFIANLPYPTLKKNILLFPFLVDGMTTALFLQHYNKNNQKLV